MRDDPCSRRSVGTGRATAVDERVAERDAAGIFHCAGVEIRHEGLVVLAEWIPARKGPVVVVKALLGHREHVLRLLAKLLAERFPRVEPESNTVVLVEHRGVRAGHQRHEVGRQRRLLHDSPVTRSDPLARAVAEHRPSLRSADVDLVARLQIGLVETGEPARRRVQKGHRVQVDLTILWIDMAVQAFANDGEVHLPLDDDGVVGSKVVQRDPSGTPCARAQLDPVEPGRRQDMSLEVDEAFPATTFERDGGSGAEGVSRRVGQV